VPLSPGPEAPTLPRRRGSQELTHWQRAFSTPSCLSRAARSEARVSSLPAQLAVTSPACAPSSCWCLSRAHSRGERCQGADDCWGQACTIATSAQCKCERAPSCVERAAVAALQEKLRRRRLQLAETGVDVDAAAAVAHKPLVPVPTITRGAGIDATPAVALVPTGRDPAARTGRRAAGNRHRTGPFSTSASPIALILEPARGREAQMYVTSTSAPDAELSRHADAEELLHRSRSHSSCWRSSQGC